MKKKLKWIIPLLAAAIIAGFFLIRYRSAGDTLLYGVAATDDGAYLLQAKEVGARQFRLTRGYAAALTLSPNGRYAAFTNRKESGKEVLLFDLTRPHRPVVRLKQYATDLLATNGGRLLSVANSTLYLNGEVLANHIRYLGALSADEGAVYCFREVVEDRLDLCRVSLSDGSVELLLENVQQSSLQVVQGEDGQDIVICAQHQIFEGTEYDLVYDPLAEADANSNDEEALKRNAIRDKLRSKTNRVSSRTVYRITGGKQEVLAEGVTYDFFCDPLTGMVVHQLSRLGADKVDILSLKEAYILEDRSWYCTVNGKRTELDELHGLTGADAFSLQFSGDGSLAICVEDELYLREPGADGLGPAQRLATDAKSFAFVRRGSGAAALYYTTTLPGRLHCREDGESRVLSEGILSAHLSCRVLPDGTRQLMDDGIYIIKFAETGLRRDKLPAVTMLSVGAPYRPKDTTLYLLQGGEHRVIANISNSYMSPIAALSDGSILAESGPLYIVGPNRTDRLASRIHANAWSKALFAGTELVTLQ